MLPSQQLKHYETTSKDIRLLSLYPCAKHLLWWLINQGAARFVLYVLTGRNPNRQPEIDQPTTVKIISLIKYYVTGLYIPVHETPIMHMLDPLHYPKHDPTAVTFTQLFTIAKATAHKFGKGPPLCILDG